MKNIRNGYTAQEAARLVVKAGLVGPFLVDIRTYDHGRDVNGNGTAHYLCYLIAHTRAGKETIPLTIVESGKRRQQVGYSGQNESALYALKQLGYTVDVSKGGSYDYEGPKEYPLIGFDPVGIEIERGMTLAAFASSYADKMERKGKPLGGEIMDQLPAKIPPAATEYAKELRAMIEANHPKCKAGISRIYEICTHLDPAGADRGTITAEAQRFARLEGFTHIKIYHEYHSHPPFGGKTWRL